MKDNNNIEELFRDGLENLEVDVNPQVWNNIASGLKTVAPSAGTVTGIKAVSSLYWIAGTISVAIISTVSVWLLKSDTKTEKLVSPIQNEKVVADKNIPKLIAIEKTPVENEAKLSLHTSTNKLVADKSEVQPKSDVQKATNNSIVADLETKQVQSENKNLDKNETTKSESSVSGSNPGSPINQPDQKPNEQSETNQNSTFPPFVAAKSIEPDMESYFGELPNSFSPNGDNHNDLFMIHPNNVKSFSVTIFDRSGKMIHQWNSPNGFWDGLLKNGTQAPTGAYIYSIIGESVDGQPLKKQGTITIFR